MLTGDGFDSAVMVRSWSRNTEGRLRLKGNFLLTNNKRTGKTANFLRPFVKMSLLYTVNYTPIKRLTLKVRALSLCVSFCLTFEPVDKILMDFN